RIGLRAAVAAGDQPLVGHLLGTLAHLTGRPDRALRLATAGYARARATGSATTRSLLLHRVAFAAARLGDRPGCQRALTAADRLYGRRDPEHDPDWLYWFDEAEVAAMTGRCFAALGRPRLAEPLLRAGLAASGGTATGGAASGGAATGGAASGGAATGGAATGVRARPWALYAAWLAAAH